MCYKHHQLKTKQNDDVNHLIKISKFIYEEDDDEKKEQDEKPSKRLGYDRKWFNKSKKLLCCTLKYSTQMSWSFLENEICNLVKLHLTSQTKK